MISNRKKEEKCAYTQLWFSFAGNLFNATFVSVTTKLKIEKLMQKQVMSSSFLPLPSRVHHLNVIRRVFLHKFVYLFCSLFRSVAKDSRAKRKEWKRRPKNSVLCSLFVRASRRQRSQINFAQQFFFSAYLTYIKHIVRSRKKLKEYYY